MQISSKVGQSSMQINSVACLHQNIEESLRQEKVVASSEIEFNHALEYKKRAGIFVLYSKKDEKYFSDQYNFLSLDE